MVRQKLINNKKLNRCVSQDADFISNSLRICPVKYWKWQGNMIFGKFQQGQTQGTSRNHPMSWLTSVAEGSHVKRMVALRFSPLQWELYGSPFSYCSKIQLAENVKLNTCTKTSIVPDKCNELSVLQILIHSHSQELFQLTKSQWISQTFSKMYYMNRSW